MVYPVFSEHYILQTEEIKFLLKKEGDHARIGNWQLSPRIRIQVVIVHNVPLAYVSPTLLTCASGKSVYKAKELAGKRQNDPLLLFRNKLRPRLFSRFHFITDDCGNKNVYNPDT